MKRRSLVAGLFLFLAVSLISLNVQAAVIVDPETGGDYTFKWYDGLGQIDAIYDPDTGWTGEVEWQITVEEDSLLENISVWTDVDPPGDEFGLLVDGEEVAWTETGTDSEGFFTAEYDDLFLASGTHTISIEVTDLAWYYSWCYGWKQYTCGWGYISFSGITPVPDDYPKPVPEPATMLLFGSGIVGLAGYRSRRKKLKQ